MPEAKTHFAQVPLDAIKKIVEPSAQGAEPAMPKRPSPPEKKIFARHQKAVGNGGAR